jgi:hypothetical protein
MSRPRREYRTTSKEVYNNFCIQNPDVKISYKDWKGVIISFNTQFANYIMETGDRQRLPHGLGQLWIGKAKPTGIQQRSINWKVSKEIGKRVYYGNLDTDGFVFRWKWDKQSSKLFQKEVWQFKPSRYICRELARKLKDPENEYKEIYRDQDKL